MVSFFPISVADSNNLTGIFNVIRVTKPDWNKTKFVDVKVSHSIVYGYYDNTQIPTGDATFLINGEKENGFTMAGVSTDQNFTITILFHSISVRITSYLFQRFYQTNFGPYEWVLEGCRNNVCNIIDYHNRTFNVGE